MPPARHFWAGAGWMARSIRRRGRSSSRSAGRSMACQTGDAKIAKGYLLPAKYVIHTVGPIWKDGQHGEEPLLISCYRASLTLACARGVRSIAFPLISSGAYGYPKDQALRIAVRAIRDFLSHTKVDMEIYLVLYDRASYDTACKLFDGIVSYME